MSLVSTIYNAPIVIGFPVKKHDTILGIKVNNHIYWGYASCGDEDISFYSEKVGKNIALSRARIKAMKEVEKALKEEVKWKEIILHEISNGKDFLEPSVYNNYNHAAARLKALKTAIKKEKTELSSYINAQAKMIDSVKRFR
jgi:hypothetical protein